MSPTYSPRARSRLAFGMLCTTLLVSGCAKTEPSPGPSARSAPATSVRPTVLGTTPTTPAPTEGSKPLPATTLASASVLKGSRVVATATGVSLEVPAGWEAYSFGVLNALADAPPARVVAAADFADESPTDYVRDRAADVEAIAVGPGRRPYSMTVAAVPLADGKDADLAEVSKDKDAQIVTWRTGLGKAKVYAYDLGNAAVVTVEAHVRRGDHVIAITAVGPHLDTTVNLLRKALPSLRAL